MLFYQPNCHQATWSSGERVAPQCRWLSQRSQGSAAPWQLHLLAGRHRSARCQQTRIPIPLEHRTDQGERQNSASAALRRGWLGGGRRWGRGVQDKGPTTHRATNTAKWGEKTKLAPLSLHWRQGQLEAGGGAVWPVIKMVQNVPSGIGRCVLV